MRIGKAIEIDLEASDEEDARRSIEILSDRLLANPVIEDWDLGFNTGNAVKYIARHNHKGEAIQDIDKAIWYLQRHKAVLEKAEVQEDPVDNKEKNGKSKKNQKYQREAYRIKPPDAVLEPPQKEGTDTGSDIDSDCESYYFVLFESKDVGCVDTSKRKNNDQTVGEEHPC